MSGHQGPNAIPGRGPEWSQAFTIDDLARLRHTLREQARIAGIEGEALDDLLVAAHELITNAIRHGGGHGTIELRRDADMLICQVTDDGPGFTKKPDVHPPAADTPGGRGLWLAQQLTDGLTLHDRRGGVTASVALRFPHATLVDHPKPSNELEPE